MNSATISLGTKLKINKFGLIGNSLRNKKDNITYFGFIDIDKIKVDYDLGNLTVTKKEIKIETISKTFDYDENEKYYSDTTILGADYDWLVDNNYSVEIVDLTILSGKGIAENVLTLKIYDFNHNDVTLSFIITYEYGTIKVI